MTIKDKAVTSEDTLSPAGPHQPYLVQDARGHGVGVIMPLADYQTVLRLLVANADWETLPPYLQDAVDNLLADEAVDEPGALRSLREILAETGETPGE